MKGVTRQADRAKRWHAQQLRSVAWLLLIGLCGCSAPSAPVADGAVAPKTVGSLRQGCAELEARAVEVDPQIPSPRQTRSPRSILYRVACQIIGTGKFTP